MEASFIQVSCLGASASSPSRVLKAKGCWRGSCFERNALR